jgi:cysteine desulfuration protein SufE
MKEFGTDISSDEIIEALSFFDSWDDRYKYIIDLGRELPPLPESERNDENIVRGCQSKVWLSSDQRDGRLYFYVDSDAFIVKGLLGVVLAAYNAKTPAEIRAFDIGTYFEALDLMRHLSPTRGSGLQAMVSRIQNIAAAAVPATSH